MLFLTLKHEENFLANYHVCSCMSRSEKAFWKDLNTFYFWVLKLLQDNYNCNINNCTKQMVVLTKSLVNPQKILKYSVPTKKNIILFRLVRFFLTVDWLNTRCQLSCTCTCDTCLWTGGFYSYGPCCRSFCVQVCIYMQTYHLFVLFVSLCSITQ